MLRNAERIMDHKPVERLWRRARGAGSRPSSDDAQRKALVDMGYHSARKQLLRSGILACIVAAGVSGCASSGLVGVWMDPQYAEKPMTNVLVIAMKPDVARRRLWEDAFANALSERGVRATPAYQLFPNELPDTNGIVGAVREHGYDGCIVTVKLPSEILTQDVQGYTTDSLVVRYNPWSHLYYDYYQQIYTPGYTETQTVVRQKIEVWRTTGKGALVWTATGEALDPTSRNTGNRHIIGEVIEDLVKHGVIPAKK